MPTTQSILTPPREVAASLTSTADAPTVAMRILLAVTVGHLLNDAIQALIPAIYPLLKESFKLSFTEIGLITLVFQCVGSVLQPLVGLYTDKHPKPFSLVYGMGITLCGLIMLALAPSYVVVLLAAACVGLGSAVFHPESSRLARMASGGRHGFAQSLFQVGGNAGTALGPLLAAGIIVPRGQRHILWFSVLALLGMFILSKVGRWYQQQLITASRLGQQSQLRTSGLGRRQIVITLCVLLCLMFSKFIYLASMTSYYTFYLMERFQISVQQSQLYLFLFLVSGVVGTLVGGPLGDRIGRKQVIWLSIFGVTPFALALPYVGLTGTAVLSVCIGLVMSSAFPAILVFATELLPGKVGLISGLCFGLAFGLAGIGSAALGKLADATSIQFVMQTCSYLPLIGLLTWFLPDLRKRSDS